MIKPDLTGAFAPIIPCTIMDIAQSKTVKILTLVLALAGMALAGVLLYQSQTLDPLPGCGGGSGCDEVLTSRWSSFFGVPVSLLALGVYVTMFAAVLMRDPEAIRPEVAVEWLMTFCGVAVIVSVLWFVFVQSVILGSFCIYCMATHASAAASAVLCLLAARPTRRAKASALASAIAVALVALLIAGQVLGDAPQAAAPKVQFVQDSPDNPQPPELPELQDLPDTMLNNPLGPDPSAIQIDPLFSPIDTATGPSSPSTTAIIQSTGPRKLSFYGGRFKVDTTTVPIIGDPYAPTVLVILFDYTCSHCRDTRATLEKTKTRHGDELAIICLPMPLNKKCNKLLRSSSPTNRYACELAEASLAVWRVAPQKWAEFDKQLYTDEALRSPARSKIAAWKLVGGEKVLKEGLDDPWVGQRIALNVRIYNACSRAVGNSLIPMLITEDGIMTGAPRHPLDIDDLLDGKTIEHSGDDGHGH